jgi:outer membrane protein OmpA-like peptidoglycan-associated protein
MSKFIFFGLLNLLFFIGFNESFAQSQEYSDYKPVYRKWQDNYILDKIEYTKSSTIFYFRFVCDSIHFAIFYEPGHEMAWYIKGKKGNNYKLKAVKNIRRNGVIMVKNLTSEKEFQTIKGYEYTTFSCEVHFDRLPNTEKIVDLIEGEGFKNDKTHFNCFDVALKTWDNKELGKVEDSEEKIEKFEDKFGIPKTDKPKVEPKVEPKPLPDANNPYPIKRIRNKRDIVCNEKLVLDKVQFQDNTTDMKGLVDCQRTLRYVYEYMTDNPKSTATIIGHSDVFGPIDRNLELSKQRAIKIQRYLSSLGINPSRIDIEYYGSQEPIVKEGSPLNRRVEIIIKCN